MFLDTFEPHLNRLRLNLFLALICIHFSPFCPKGTLPPSEHTEAVKGKRKKYCSYVKKKEPI